MVDRAGADHVDARALPRSPRRAAAPDRRRRAAGVTFSTPVSAVTAWSIAWKRRKLPTQPTTNRSPSPRRARTSPRGRVGGEHLGVDSGGRHDDARRVDADPYDLVDDRVGAAGDDVGAPQRFALAETFEGSAPARTVHAPDAGLPDQRGRHEHDRRDATGRPRARSPRPGRARAVATRTRGRRPRHGPSRSTRNDRARRYSRASFNAVFTATGSRLAPRCGVGRGAASTRTRAAGRRRASEFRTG